MGFSKPITYMCQTQALYSFVSLDLMAILICVTQFLIQMKKFTENVCLLSQLKVSGFAFYKLKKYPLAQSHFLRAIFQMHVSERC
jgi:hypothetical protein